MASLVDRTLDVFERFAEGRQPMTLSDLSRALEIPVSSCHDLVRILQRRGYLYEVGPRIGYYPTIRLERLGTKIVTGDPIVKRAELVLGRLRDALDESVFLSKIQGLQATYLLAIEASRPLRVMANVGDDLGPIHAKSAGKALLSLLSEQALEDYLASAELVAITERTVISKERLREQIELGSKRGWFINDGEAISGVKSVSAIFKWNHGAYAVTVAGPAMRLESRIEAVAGLLTQACREIERAGAA